MKPFVSICLPVYNGQKYLRTAVESVLSQTCPEFELLIPDDCSSDRSFEIIADLAKQDRRIKCWRNIRRLGLFANYNQCIRNARGEFIKPMAQDDILDCTMLERALAVFESHSEVCLVSAARLFIDESGAELDSEIPLTPLELLGQGGLYPAAEVIRKSLSPLRNFIGEPSTVIFRSSAAGRGFSEEFRHIGDLEYWLRILCENGDYAYVGDKLVSYRVHSESQSRRNMAQLVLASDIILMESACKHLFEKLQLDPQEFLAESLLGLAHAVGFWCSTGELSETSLAQGESAAAEEISRLRKALLHCLLLLGNSTQKNGRDTKIIGRELRISCAERQLKLLLNSWPWHLTRPLRELNSLISGLSQTPHLHHEWAQTDKLEQQNFYLAYLRKQRRAIIRSRSWQLLLGLRISLKGLFRHTAFGRTS